MSGEVYIVFRRGERRWWNRFLDKEINHCEALIPWNGQWIVYGKAYEAVDLFLINDCSDILRTSTLVKAVPIKRTRWILMLNTCVGQIKQLLGIRNPFILTPKQLHKYLTR